MSAYGSITSLSESPLVEGLIYAGTDDGLIQVTEDGGATWRKAGALPGARDSLFINDIKADLHDPTSCTPRGTTTSRATSHRTCSRAAIAVGRGFRSPEICQAPPGVAPGPGSRRRRPAVCGDEFGVFFTVDAGAGGLRSRAAHRRFHFATWRSSGARTTWSARRSARLLGARRLHRAARHHGKRARAGGRAVPGAHGSLVRRALAARRRGKASQGDAYFVAPNPPFGAVFTYYLREDLQTAKSARREREKKAAETGGTRRIRGDVILTEDREEEPGIVLTVRNAQGEVVRRLGGPVKAGFHRVAWNLHYPSTAVDAEGNRAGLGRAVRRHGPPGAYTVSLAKRVDGKLVELVGPSRSSRVDPRAGARGSDAGGRLRLPAPRGRARPRRRGDRGARRRGRDPVARDSRTLMRTPTAYPALDDEVRRLEREIAEMKLALVGARSASCTGTSVPYRYAAGSRRGHGTQGSMYGRRRTCSTAPRSASAG